MIIRRIEMINFRGFRKKTIDFKDKSVVLFSAANGVGKTTTIDAIEWCLTGDIGRLKNAFDTRSKNETDRKLNTDGILKHRDAGTREKIKVVLWVSAGEKEIVLCRRQIKDELNPELSKVTIDENENKAKAFIQEYVGDSFYNFHFCDIQKSFDIQSKRRKDLKDLFSEFITNYDVQKRVAASLEIFAEDVERYIDDKKNEKIPPKVIEEHEKQLEKMCAAAKQITYPEILFYTGEKTDIAELNKDELIAQEIKLKNCGYQEVREKLSKLAENEALKSQYFIAKKIASYWETKTDSIQSAMKVGILKNSDTITTLEMKLRRLNGLSLSRDTIFQVGESVTDLNREGFTKSDFDLDKKTIEEKEENVKNLSTDIDLLSQNNKMLKLLSTLSANKQVIIEYRDNVFKESGRVRCPVCGSASFGTMEKDLILKEADDYIRQNGENVKAKEMKRLSLQKEITTLYEKVINCAKNVVENEKKILEAKINKLKGLKDEIQPYLDEVSKLKEAGKTINVEELTIEKIEELIISIKSKLLEESLENEIKKSYQQILAVLGYKYENETIQQTYEKVKNLVTESYEISNFSYDVFVSKLNAISNILSNKELSDLRQSLDKDNKKNLNLDIEIEKLQKLKETASQRAQDIKELVEKLSKDEYEKVGPTLSKFYNKLARFNSNEGINIVQESEGISLIDDKRKNIVNILSNGQISVFMLSYFFAGINARNSYEKMKLYFIDDLTACMDDVNMLAFMDLLKYQMTSKATMEQLFFITCDDRISRLLKYKLSGRGIEICELIEEDFI